MTWGRWLTTVTLALALVSVVPQTGADFTSTTNSSASFSALWPPQTSLVWWLDASDPASLFQLAGCTTAVTAPSDPVGCWKDRRAGHSQVTTAAGQGRATWNGVIRNSRRTVHFGDAQQLSGLDLFGGSASNVHIFAVVREVARVPSALLSLNGANSNSAAGQASSRFSLHMPWYTGEWFFDPNGTASRVTAANATAVGAWTLFEGSKDAAAGKHTMVLNDHITPTPVNAAGAALTAGGLMLGDNNGAWTPAASANHDVAEILIYDRVLSAAEVDKVVAYLTTKWGTFP